MSRSTFTVFFCGTGSNSYDYRKYEQYHNGELCTVLAKHHEGMEFVDWIIVDGPGSGNRQIGERWVKSTRFYNWWGAMTGAGMSDNMNHAMAVYEGNLQLPEDQWTEYMKLNVNLIKRFRGDGPAPTVNLVGYSRGGAECILFANMLYKKHPTTKVNIVAFDPVPGGGKLTGTYSGLQSILRSNVKNYIGIYAIDERSQAFTPVIPALEKGYTKKYILQMPGKHATMVGDANWKGEIIATGPGKINRHLAEQALTEWGVELRNTLDLTNDEILRIYDGMYAKKQVFKKMHQKVYVLFAQRTFDPFDKTNWKSGFLGIPRMKFRTLRGVKHGKNWTNMEDLARKGVIGTQETDFINKHHIEIFRTRFPNLYNFQKMTEFGREYHMTNEFSAQAVRSDYKKAIATCPNLTIKIYNRCPEMHDFVGQIL